MTRTIGRSHLQPERDSYATPRAAIEPLAHLLAEWAKTLWPSVVIDLGAGDGRIGRSVVRAISRSPELQSSAPPPVVGVDLPPRPNRMRAGMSMVWGRYPNCWESLEATAREVADFPENEKFNVMIVSNPPFSQAEEFLQHAVGEVLTSSRVSENSTASFLLRLNMLGSRRRMDFWNRYPPAVIQVLVPRPSFTPDGHTDATEYAWFTWRHALEAISRSKVEVIQWR